MSVVLDVAGILAGVAAILAAFWSRQTKKQTNGPIKAANDTLTLVYDAVRSVGHQVGEVRKDLGRVDERLSGEVAELRRRFDGPA